MNKVMQFLILTGSMLCNQFLTAQIPMGMLNDTTVKGPVKSIHETIYRSGSDSQVEFENKYEFDESGNFIKEFNSRQGGPFHLKMILSYSNDHLVKKAFFSERDTEPYGVWEYRYDNDGRVIYENDGMFVKEFVYDNDGRLISETNGNNKTRYEYSSDGKTAMVHQESEYDRHSHEEHYNEAGEIILKKFLSWEGKECSETIDRSKKGTVITVNDCTNSTLTEEFDEYGRLLRSEEIRKKEDGTEKRRVKENTYNNHGQYEHTYTSYGEGSEWEDKYEYEYDQHGNWTKITSFTRESADQEFMQSTTVTRVFTYY